MLGNVGMRSVCTYRYSESLDRVVRPLFSVTLVITGDISQQTKSLG